MSYPLIDYVDLLIVRSDGTSVLKKSGDRTAFDTREIEHRNINFVLELAPNETLVLYLKAQTESSLQGPLRLWSPEKFISHSGREQTVFSVYAGIMIAMVCYNLFLYLKLRLLSQLYYVLYLFFFMYSSFALYGWAFQFLTPSFPALANFLGPFSISISGIFVFLFSQEFLQLKLRHPYLNRGAYFFIFWAVVGAVCSFFSYSVGIQIGAIWSIFAALAICVASVICQVKGYRPARFFVLAFISLCVGVFVTNLRAIGLLEPNLFTVYSHYVGSALEVVLLSIALGDKIKIEQDEAQAAIKTLNMDLTQTNQRVLQMNEELEFKVDEKTRDIRSIMSHLRFGVFTIVPPGVVHKDYSAHLESILEQAHIEGKDYQNLLFADSDVSEDALSLVSNSVQSSLGETGISFEMNENSFIREIRKNFSKDHVKVLELDWSPILNSDDVTEKILVTVRDVTQLRELELLVDERKKEANYITEIAAIPREHFNRFVNTCQRMLEENEKLLAKSSSFSSEALKILFINLHTMKGVARSLGLRFFSEVLHLAEDYAANLQKGLVECDYAKLHFDHKTVKVAFENYVRINTVVLGRKIEYKKIDIDIGIMEKILSEVRQLRAFINPEKGISQLKGVESLLSQYVYQRGDQLFKEIFGAVERLARDLGKEMPSLVINVGSFTYTRDGAEILRNSFSHLIRNAMDHGIEAPLERKSKGKASQGKLELNIKEQNGHLHLTLQDDGRGLAIKMIQEVAIIQGLIKRDEQLTADRFTEVVCLPGFSTSHSVNEISGRGVGMSDVKDHIEAAGGLLQLKFVHSTVDLESDFVPFVIEISLPERFYSELKESPNSELLLMAS